ncbi:hypothetical protein N9599_03915 [Candidatus Pelagibacter sp.]|nr:hypothetical protein [Candidatus Pelagibacter sp.]
MVKNKLKNETIYASCLLLFFLSFSYFYADFFNLNRNWTSQYDQEVAIAYNALLFNSALPQEYTDHTAYFLILSSSFYLKLMKLLGFLDIYKFSQVSGVNAVNDLDLNGVFQDVVFHLRCFSFGINALTAVAITYLFNLIFKRKIFSFILGVMTFYLYGNINNLTNIRSEQFSILFLILSLIVLKIFFEKNRIIYLISFFILLFCSILQKSQVIFFVPVILLFTFYINEKKISINFSFLENININKNKIILQIIFFLIIFITFKSLIFGKDYKTWLFLITLIAVVNLYFFKISNYLTFKNNLIVFNFSLILGYALFNIIIFLHPSAPLKLLDISIFKIIYHAGAYVKDANTTVPYLSILDFLLVIYKLFIENISLIMNVFFNPSNAHGVNVYSILFITSFFGLIICFKRYSMREKKLILSIFLAFIFISQVNFMRFNFIRYYVYSDYLVVLILGIVLNKFGKKISISISTLILISIILVNFNFIEDQKGRPLEYNLCSEGRIYYFTEYANKIPLDKIKDFCSNKYD